MANIAVLSRIADVAQIVRRAPNQTLIGAYVRAARKFCRETRWYRSTLVGQTADATRLYSLGSDPDLEVVGLAAVSAARLTGNTKPWALQVTDPTSWTPNSADGPPRRYAYVPEAQVAIDPLPDAAYTLTLTLVLQPKAGVVTLPEELFVKWDQVLQAGALAYLFEIPGQPWSNPVEAERQRRTFQAGINNARAEVQKGYQAGTSVVRRRPFVVGSIR